MAKTKKLPFAEDDVQTFDLEGKEIRVLSVNGSTWFVAKDLFAALDMSANSKALKRLRKISDDNCRKLRMFSNGEKQTGLRFINVINEPAFYELIIRSNKPKAVQLRHWLTSEVLPSSARFLK